MPSARVRTNVGVTSRGGASGGVGTLSKKDFHSTKRLLEDRSAKFIRTSLPMGLNPFEVETVLLPSSKIQFYSKRLKKVFIEIFNIEEMLLVNE